MFKFPDFLITHRTEQLRHSKNTPKEKGNATLLEFTLSEEISNTSKYNLSSHWSHQSKHLENKNPSLLSYPITFGFKNQNPDNKNGDWCLDRGRDSQPQPTWKIQRTPFVISHTKLRYSEKQRERERRRREYPKEGWSLCSTQGLGADPWEGV